MGTQEVQGALLGQFGRGRVVGGAGVAISTVAMGQQPRRAPQKSELAVRGDRSLNPPGPANESWSPFGHGLHRGLGSSRTLLAKVICSTNVPTAPQRDRFSQANEVLSAWSGSDADVDTLSYMVRVLWRRRGIYETIAIDHESDRPCQRNHSHPTAGP